MLLPEKEIFINKTVNIRGNNVYLISLTLEKHSLQLVSEETFK